MALSKHNLKRRKHGLKTHRRMKTHRRLKTGRCMKTHRRMKTGRRVGYRKLNGGGPMLGWL